MIDLPEISHHIQKHILGVLVHKEFARFVELRPSRVETNLFTYHLKCLVRFGYIEKTELGYSLSVNGLQYVDKISTDKMTPRFQPKIITMFVIQNSEGELLLQKRNKQPFINKWTLPHGKIHMEDNSIGDAAKREIKEKLGIAKQPTVHAGDAYIRVRGGSQEVITTTLAHIFKFNRDDIKTDDNTKWVKPHKLHSYSLAPAVEKIVARTFFNDPFFFEEFEDDLV